MSPTIIEVPGNPGYPIALGAGAVALLASDAFVPIADRAVAIISAADVSQHASAVAAQIGSRARAIHRIDIPGGEGAKSIAIAERAWAQLAEIGIGRGDLIISVGGGATTDIAGFIAGSWMRGIDIVHVATTTAAMVDAAIGGKTAINISMGKNLVGVFHDPRAVICDLDTLSGLPAAEKRAGLAEVLKCGFIADVRILDAAAADPGVFLADPQEAYEAAIRVKAAVVASDAREALGGSLGREVLNYGHTLAHALEAVSGFAMRHGEAVAIGMVFAAHVSRLMGGCADDLVQLHRTVLASVGLPTQHDLKDASAVMGAMQRDKKARDGGIRMVLLRDVGDAYAVNGIDHSILLAAFEATSAHAAPA